MMKDHPQRLDVRERLNWDENEMKDNRDVIHQPQQDIHRSREHNKSTQPSLQERLRSLANHEMPPSHNNAPRPHFGAMEMGHNGNGADQDRMRGMETGSLIIRSDLGIGRNVGLPGAMSGIDSVGGNAPMYALSPNLASSLRGAPLTSAGTPTELGVRILRPPNDAFGTPNRLAEEPFTPRHLLGTFPYFTHPNQFLCMKNREMVDSSIYF